MTKDHKSAPSWRNALLWQIPLAFLQCLQISPYVWLDTTYFRSRPVTSVSNSTDTICRIMNCRYCFSRENFLLWAILSNLFFLAFCIGPWQLRPDWGPGLGLPKGFLNLRIKKIYRKTVIEPCYFIYSVMTLTIMPGTAGCLNCRTGSTWCCLMSGRWLITKCPHLGGQRCIYIGLLQFVGSLDRKTWAPWTESPGSTDRKPWRSIHHGNFDDLHYPFVS